MGTSSMIGFIKEDGSVVSTYCHYDGYVDGVGETLYKYYQSSEAAEKLASVGYLSSLSHDLDENIKAAVHIEDPVYYLNADVFLKCGHNNCGAQYLYLFDGTDWNYSSTNLRGTKRDWQLV